MQTFGELGVYLGWFVLFIAIGAAIGRAAKGRPGVGAFLGALLGPLGWIVVLLFKDLRARCPECRRVIDPVARKCGGCGSPIAQPAPV